MGLEIKDAQIIYAIDRTISRNGTTSKLIAITWVTNGIDLSTSRDDDALNIARTIDPPTPSNAQLGKVLKRFLDKRAMKYARRYDVPPTKAAGVSFPGRNCPLSATNCNAELTNAPKNTAAIRSNSQRSFFRTKSFIQCLIQLTNDDRSG